MYESPINIIYRDIKTKFENEVLQAVQAVDINVNKSELIKALQYDRNQYEKGYADAQAEQKKGKWINRGLRLYMCSECARFSPTQENFCPNCGADMRGKDNAEIH